ncbi:hypothetical protein SAMN02745225_02397 [Ferrithrix thermotolerans DSM 19514]|uniref:Uncharacterized protein n=1 Tax=Ferrithrix thermotolerans DSM 19514 TaxID=1121881 RepID=A0A1M4YRA9_9ACTN|nr:hypothetical protein SAMN02745225_02397 [Ferrithrix thermotolerans DSM 19514]
MLNTLPPLHRLLDELEAQAEEAGTRDAVLGAACSLSYRGKGRSYRSDPSQILIV